jgi:hypothetical protein
MMQTPIMPRFLLQLFGLLPAGRKKILPAGIHVGKRLVKKTDQAVLKPERFQYATGAYTLNNMTRERLEHIIHQVHAEEYCVEYLSTFAWEGADSNEIVIAVSHWAKRSGLKVSINHERGICFFEKR